MREKMLDIHLLGPPRVYLDGKKIAVNRTITRALLFYLAMHPKAFRREQLYEFFWPEKELSWQQQNFRRHLANLKASFPENDILETSPGIVGLKRDILNMDVFVLFEAVEKMREYATSWQNGTTLPPALYDELVHASNLCQNGDIFMDGDEMDVSPDMGLWHEEKNLEIQRKLLELNTFLARFEDSRGRPEKAIIYVEKAIFLDKYDENLHVLFLSNLRKLGRINKARDHYSALREDKDLAGLFSKDFKALGEELFQQREANHGYMRPDWNIQSPAPFTFVGQKEPLDLLRGSYHIGTGALILGEAGAGKTRLVQESYQLLDAPPRLLLMSCSRTDENIPYYSWIGMFKRTFTNEFWKETPATWTKPLVMLLPEIVEIRDDLDADINEVYAASIIFEAIKKLLAYIQQHGPYLLVVDDAQWADRASIAVLTYLLQESVFKHPSASLVITSRLEEKNKDLDTFISSTFENVILIELMRLPEDEIGQLAYHILNKDLPPETLKHLREKTGGNPFYLLEMLHHSFIQNNGNKNNIENMVIPPSVKRNIEMRFSSLSEPARKLLLLAAIQGSPFELSVLEKAAELNPDETSLLIGELEKAQLLYPFDKSTNLKYIFIHEIFREELIEFISPAEARVYHKRIAEALESMYGTVSAAKASILAEHYENAGDFPKAFSFWTRAARYAYRLFSINDANISYERAEALISKTALSDEEIYEIYASWGAMLFQCNDPDMLEEVMQRLETLGEGRSSSLLVGAALDGISDACMNRNQFERGLGYVKEALPLLEASKHIPAQMNALIHQGVFIYMLNNFPGSQQSFEKVLALGKGKKDPASVYALGHANYQMATIFTGMGFPAKAISYAKESLHAMRLSGFPHGSILPYSMMGLAHYYLGNYQEGKIQSLKSAALAKQTGSSRMLGYASAYAGMNETELAEFGDAWKHARQAIDIGEKHGHTEIISMGYKILGDIYARLGSLSQAQKYYHLGVVVDHPSFAKLENLSRLAVTLSLLGDSQGEAQLKQALAYTDAAGLDVIGLNTKALALNIYVQRGNYDAFLAHVDEIKDEIAERSPQSSVWITYLHALFLSNHEDFEEALTLLQKNLSVLEKTDFFWIKFRAYKLQAFLLQTLERDAKIPRSKLETMLFQIENSLDGALIEEEWKTFAARTRESY